MSKLSITFQFDNEAEGQAFLLSVMSATDLPAAKPIEVAVEKSAKPRLRSKPATATPVVTPEPAAPSGEFTNRKSEANNEGPVVAAAPTIDDVRAALRTVFNKPGGTGAAAATALLTKFGATSVSTIPAAKYAEFIEACK